MLYGDRRNCFVYWALKAKCRRRCLPEPHLLRSHPPRRVWLPSGIAFSAHRQRFCFLKDADFGQKGRFCGLASNGAMRVRFKAGEYDVFNHDAVSLQNPHVEARRVDRRSAAAAFTEASSPLPLTETEPEPRRCTCQTPRGASQRALRGLQHETLVQALVDFVSEEHAAAPAKATDHSFASAAAEASSPLAPTGKEREPSNSLRVARLSGDADETAVLQALRQQPKLSSDNDAELHPSSALEAPGSILAERIVLLLDP